MAQETENRGLDARTVGAGVARLMERPHHGFYVVAEDAAGKGIAGSLMVTTEWSDWRNGLFWWIQSVYVRAERRRQGVMRALFEHVRERARADRDVCGLRLYVETDNAVAREVYRRLGLRETAYRLLEIDFTQ